MWVLIFADIIDVIIGCFTVASLLVRNCTLSCLWLAELKKKIVQRCIWLKWEYQSFYCLISEHLNFSLIPLFHGYCNACSQRLTNASFQSCDAMPSSVARGFCLVIVLIQWQICQILTTIWKYPIAGLSILRLLGLKITRDDLLSLNF